MFEVIVIDRSEKAKLKGLFDEYLRELYKYDKDIKFDDSGKPVYKYFDFYWEDDDRYPIGLYVDGSLAGFMLLREIAQNALEVAEFYIAPQYRGNGYGKRFFNEILGKINKKVHFFTKKTNIIAKSFWNNVVQEHYFWSGENEKCFTWLVSKTPIILHNLNIKEEYFEKIKRREKIYEGRLFDEKRKNFNEGDIIKFTCGEKNFCALIEERKIFKNFKEMADNVEKSELGFKEKSKNEMIETYRSFYTLEDELKYGVVIFKVILL